MNNNNDPWMKVTRRIDPQVFRRIDPMAGYESPITVRIHQIAQEIEKRKENEIVCHIEEALGFDINRDELVKAMNYDRDQYKQGFKAGYSAAKDWSEWVVDDFTGIIDCKKCHTAAPIDITSGEQYRSSFCPGCGLAMMEEDAKEEA